MDDKFPNRPVNGHKIDTTRSIRETIEQNRRAHADVNKSMLEALANAKKAPTVEPRILPMLQYGEAYKLMKYRCEQTGIVEWFWNSRDGITPFIVRGPTGDMQHVDFHEDVTAPNFVPAEGQRIFTDKPGFDPNLHQFDLEVVVVDVVLRNKFRDDASFRPWVPKPRSPIVRPNGGRYA